MSLRKDYPGHMIEIQPGLVIDEKEIHEDFVRSSGPGGQNVNKVATAVQLRFNIIDSPNLTREIKERLIQIAGSRVTDEGILVIDARRFRTQERNRLDALQRLVELIKKAAKKPKTRLRTKPTAKSKRVRLEKKQQRGEIKRLRRKINRSDDYGE